MNDITLDQATIDKLGGLTKPTVLRDAQGCVLAVVSPTNAIHMHPLISDEEIDRRTKNPGKCYTTEEVLKHLESL